MIEGFSAWIASESPARGERALSPEPTRKELADIDGFDQRGHAIMQDGMPPGRRRCRAIWVFRTAAVCRQRTARMEDAAARQIAQPWRKARNASERAALLKRRQRSDQRSVNDRNPRIHQPRHRRL
jgi:hypothetical protein